jgi:hypothetical protein
MELIADDRRWLCQTVPNTNLNFRRLKKIFQVSGHHATGAPADLDPPAIREALLFFSRQARSRARTGVQELFVQGTQ